MKEIHAQVQASLDKFFADEDAWQQVLREVTRTMKLRASSRQLNEPIPGRKASFRVQVPKPYPGVHYRKTKDLDDKFPRYAKHGSTVQGEVEEDREWLRVRVRGDSLYLPLRIGPVQILEPLPEPCGEAAPSAASR